MVMPNGGDKQRHDDAAIQGTIANLQAAAAQNAANAALMLLCSCPVCAAGCMAEGIHACVRMAAVDAIRGKPELLRKITEAVDALIAAEGGG